LVFIGLSFLPCCAGGEICVDNGNIAKIGSYDPSFGIALQITISVLYVVWFYFSEDGHAAVSFFLGGVPVILVAEFFELLEVNILAVCFYFLEADDISGIGAEPFTESFGHSGTEPVDVIGNDSHAFLNLEQK